MKLLIADNNPEDVRNLIGPNATFLKIPLLKLF